MLNKLKNSIFFLIANNINNFHELLAKKTKKDLWMPASTFIKDLWLQYWENFQKAQTILNFMQAICLF